MSDPTQPTPPPYPGSAPIPPPPPPGYGQVGYGQQPAYGQPAGFPPHPYGAPVATPPYAHWGRRVAATLLDLVLLVPAYVVAAVGGVIASAGTDEYGNVTSGAAVGLGITIAVVAYVALLVFVIWNQIFRQGRTGSSLGKQWMSIRVVAENSGQPIGAGLTFVRQLCHIVDSLLCYIGYLWPLWDAKRQTFADKIMSTIVLHHPVEP